MRTVFLDWFGTLTDRAGCPSCYAACSCEVQLGQRLALFGMTLKQ